MTFTLTFTWWWVPTLITVAGLIWAIFIVGGDGGRLSGIDNLLALVPVLAVSALAWAIVGALK